MWKKWGVHKSTEWRPWWCVFISFGFSANENESQQYVILGAPIEIVPLLIARLGFFWFGARVVCSQQGGHSKNRGSRAAGLKLGLGDRWVYV